MERLEKPERDFFGRGVGLGLKFHLVGWDIVSKTKKDKDLGLRRLTLFDKALL